jgi:tRNA(Ile)-lysidine synthase
LNTSPFSTERLLTTLEALSLPGPYYVAYSGGLDSHVLLHALTRLQSRIGIEIRALYVNHGLNDKADIWGTHCEKTCKNLNIIFTQLKITESCPKGESREAWARKLRYDLLKKKVGTEGTLLTAHHQDDQAETLLIQLIRGSGAQGLAAMPLIKNRTGMLHARPLLEVSRQQLLTYAKKHDLQWIEDDSNNDLSYDRNFFRKEILPMLRLRWSNVSRTLARVSAHQAEVISILDDIGEIDLLKCIGDTSVKLNTRQIMALSSARQSNVIRYWIRQANFSVPGSKKIRQILDILLPARGDTSPMVTWPGCEIRRYKEFIYVCKPILNNDNSSIVNWQMDSPCLLGDALLSARLGQGEGIKTDICPDGRVQVRYRQGGEKIQLKNKKHRQALKKLFQEKGVPPWMRGRIPLLYVGDILLAVAGLWIDVAACSKDSEISWQIEWTGLDEYCNADTK